MNREPGGTIDLLDALAELPAEPTPTAPLPRRPIDAHTQAVLDLVRGNPLHDRDRARIVAAIVEDAVDHDGHVDPNRVRGLLVHPLSEELDVNPRVIGAVYAALAAAGALVFTEYVLNEDRHGGNAGKPCKAYRLTRTPTSEDHS